MRVDELTIINFKCFENEKFRFNKHFNVVIGKNASGKTSLLEAIGITISSYLQTFTDPKLLDNNDVRTVLIHGQPKPQLPCSLIFDLFIHGQPIKGSYISLETISEDKNTKNQLPEGEKIASVARLDLQESRQKNNKVKFPLLAYYGTGRLWLHHNEIDYFKQEEGVFLAYKNCLSAHSSSNVFLSWFKTLEDAVKKFDQPIHKLQLKLFKDAISTLVPEWTDMSFSYLEDDLIGIFKSDDGVLNMLPFKKLSDGYRNLIGMVADMIYRCVQLNPWLGEKVTIETEGVVLIDEIDLHLHPEWQKKIVGDLKKVFPGIQFIASTHSPFIVQSLAKDELIILKNEAAAIDDPWRQSIEEIAEEEMQVTDVRRSELFKKRELLAYEYYTLLKENNPTDSLRQKIAQTKMQLDKLSIEFSDDPAYVAMLRAQFEKIESNAAGK